MIRALATCLLTLVLAAGAAANPIQCRFAELVRDIEVVYAYPGQAVPCEVIYRKSMEGSVETPWRAYAESGFCEARAQHLADTLSKAGWQCVSVAAAADPAADQPPDESGIPNGEPAEAGSATLDDPIQ